MAQENTSDAGEATKPSKLSKPPPTLPKELVFDIIDLRLMDDTKATLAVLPGTDHTYHWSALGLAAISPAACEYVIKKVKADIESLIDPRKRGQRLGSASELLMQAHV